MEMNVATTDEELRVQVQSIRSGSLKHKTIIVEDD